MAVNIYCSMHGSNLVNRYCHFSTTAVIFYSSYTKSGVTEINGVKMSLRSKARLQRDVLQEHNSTQSKELKGRVYGNPLDLLLPIWLHNTSYGCMSHINTLQKRYQTMPTILRLMFRQKQLDFTKCSQLLKMRL